MKYINTKTQAVIETACVISGGNWKPVTDKQPKKVMEETGKKRTTKKSGEC